MQTAALPHVGGSGSDENGSELPSLPSTLNLENFRVELSPRYGSFGLNPLQPDVAPVSPQFGQTAEFTNSVSNMPWGAIPSGSSCFAPSGGGWSFSYSKSQRLQVKGYFVILIHY